MEQKEVKWVYDTVLSAPGMEDLVKIDFRISRKTVLLLSQVIERGLQVKGNGLPESVSPDILEELRTLSGNCLEKAGIGIINGKTNDVWNSIKGYVPSLFAMFSESALSVSSAFINNNLSEAPTESIEEIINTNCYKDDGLEIEITSVHAVKGQTHCATLYLESFYDRGYGNYESERLRNQFLSVKTVSETLSTVKTSHDKIRQSAKMAYVGFSRPTDLLCIAVHKDRYDNFLSGINRQEWEIIEVSDR